MKLITRAVQAGLVGMLGVSAVFAQNITDAKKAIDAEKYQQAKTILKGLIAAQPGNGENYFYLGNVYLKNDYRDSAKAVYTQGSAAKDDNLLNFVGLGTVDLLSKNSSAAQANFDKAISMAKKKDYTPYLYIGRAYQLSGDYANALTNLEKAKAINEKSADVYLSIGEAYSAQKKNSEAFSAYRTAFDLDKNMFRAKIELGKSVRRAKAFPESASEFKAILATDPNYAPAYRELAETYYQWAKDQPADYNNKITEALGFYHKYMDLTDRSLDSRMRYADFLVLSGKYTELEQEAQQMAQMDKANPRIYRYLGYSAFENGHIQESISALKTFMSKVSPERVIAQDHYYLGRAYIANNDTTGIGELGLAMEADSSYSKPISEMAKTNFTDKKYELAAKLYNLAVMNSASSTLVYDHFYLGMAHYFDYAGKDAATQKTSRNILVQADSAFSYVSQKSPTTPDSYLYRGRVNRLLDDEHNTHGYMVPFYEKYVEVVLQKPEAATDARYKRTLSESYNNLGAYYLSKDTAKAKDYFTKTIALDPSNTYAAEALKSLGN